MNEHEFRGYLFSDDKSKLDLDSIYAYLSRSYWAKGRKKAVIEKSIGNSHCFGVYYFGEQVGFARAVTDYSTFVYLADVFILESHRKKSLGKELIKTIIEHPKLADISTWTLLTADAHSLYQKYGFENHSEPKKFMIRKKLVQKEEV